ncbi:hypothetical protein CTATCC11996_11353 [Comamonas testosteroni ATCC 11996]|nr:hypothetical protein CTATCC11996_11353 [Comamonas testosteroni ATCC 11996]
MGGVALPPTFNKTHGFSVQTRQHDVAERAWSQGLVGRGGGLQCQSVFHRLLMLSTRLMRIRKAHSLGAFFFKKSLISMIFCTQFSFKLAM